MFDEPEACQGRDGGSDAYTSTDVSTAEHDVCFHDSNSSSVHELEVREMHEPVSRYGEPIAYALVQRTAGDRALLHVQCSNTYG